MWVLRVLGDDHYKRIFRVTAWPHLQWPTVPSIGLICSPSPVWWRLHISETFSNVTETHNQSSKQTNITLKVCFYIFMFGYLSFAKEYHLKEVKIITSQREKYYTAIHTCLFCRGFPCILLCSHLSRSRLCDGSHSGQRSDHILHCSHLRNILLHILLKKK